MKDRQEVWVRADEGRRNYPVILEPGVRGRLVELLARFVPGVRRWAVISDTHVAPLHAEDVSAALREAGLGGTLLTTPAGEREKTRRNWAALTDRLLEEGLGRDGGVVAVGGGVVGDLAGFVAATFMRGIPVVQLPTSLLAMIDASVGGKTGVDTRAGKNLVGAFHPPSLVLVDPQVIATLPREERAQGLVEAVKHGAILDEGYGDQVAGLAPAILAGDPDAVQGVVHRSVEIKAQVVGDDEHEAGLREILNFGHTVGHALERAGGYSLSHGTAVAQGMLWEARLGVALGVTAPGTEERLRAWLEPLGIDLDPGPLDAGALS
ncbi:MAG TPA: 3-dehydroquinate synthase, partial [Longimicrobiales bacterium]|nr:3-dehydroquinate synthase [Longimicrobiales bacterium]